jgi:catechol 2,3-dioxygenase-like lactoylglutathione lyase family enzyme
VKVDLDHTVVTVSDWERSNAFYRDVLGAEVVPRGPVVAYRFGDRQLNVHGPGFDAFPQPLLPVAPGNSDICFVWDGPIEAAVGPPGRLRGRRRARPGAARRCPRHRHQRLLPRPG